uniref:Uncharacterized protein n=1 Tax=Schizaphis graminum TaxID=13262 RepID=A0A2S2PKT4_SCHGA
MTYKYFVMNLQSSIKIAADSDLRNLRKRMRDREEDVSDLDKYIESVKNIADLITSLPACVKETEAECSEDEDKEYLNKLRSLLLDALADISFWITLSHQPMKILTYLYFIINFGKLQNTDTGTDTDLSWIENVKKAISNLN